MRPQLSPAPPLSLPQVAACVCLFSLDKHEAIPVDTHVWALATRYYTPHLRGKALTKKVHGEVQTAFVERCGTGREGRDAFAVIAHPLLVC